MSRTRLPLLLLFAAFLRLYHLGEHSLWLDELFSVRAAERESLGGLIDELANDVHPPLYFLLLRGWLALPAVGAADAWVRVMGALWGVLGVWGTVLLGEKLGKNGLLGGLLYAVAPFAVGLEREARSNGMLTALSLWAGIFLLTGIEKPDDRRFPGVYALFAVALLYTHPFGIFVLVAHGLYLLGRRARLGPWIIAWVAAGVAWLPWLKILMGQASHFSETPWYQLPSGDSLALLGESLSGGVGPGILLILGVSLAMREGEESLAWLVAQLGGLLLLPWILSYTWAPILRDRNVLPLLPVFCIVAGQGWSLLRVRGAGLFVVGVSLMATVRAVFMEPEIEQWRSVAEIVKKDYQPGDRIFANHTWLWRWYLPEPLPLEQLPPALPTHGRVWFLFGHEDTAFPTVPADQVLHEQFLRGAKVRLADLSRHALVFGADAPPPTRVDGVLHLYWAQSLIVEQVAITGTCTLRVLGYGDPAAGEPAKLELLLTGDEGEKRFAMDLPLKEAEVQTKPFTVNGPVRAQLTFVNDAKIGDEDRNAHIREVVAECE